MKAHSPCPVMPMLKCEWRRMAKVLLAMVITAVLPTGTSLAWAKSPCAHVGPSRDIICVCNKRYCWLEPGTRYRFDALFRWSKSFEASGILGVWQPVRIPRTTRKVMVRRRGAPQPPGPQPVGQRPKSRRPSPRHLVTGLDYFGEPARPFTFRELMMHQRSRPEYHKKPLIAARRRRTRVWWHKEDVETLSPTSPGKDWKRGRKLKNVPAS
jgi:hypothetical protein